MKNASKTRLRVGVVVIAWPCACSSASGGADPGPDIVFPDGSVAPTPVCVSEGGSAPVAAPVRVRTLTGDKSWAETGWFSSPGLADLDGDGKKEIVAPFYSLFVFDSAGALLGTIKEGAYTQDRIYAPAVVADLEGDGVMDIVAAGNEGTVGAYEWRNGALTIKAGWPASTTSDGQSPEGRGMAAGDLDGDGKIEVVVTTTNTAETRRAGLRLLAERQAVPARGHELAGLAALQHGHRSRRRRGHQRAGPGRLRLLWPERRHRQHRRRSPAGSHRHLRQPLHQRLQARRHFGAGVPVLHQPRQRVQGPALHLGPVHPLGRSAGRGEPLPPAHRRLARRQRNDVAAMDRLAAFGRRSRRRRQERGHRPAQRRDEGALRDPGLSLRGAAGRARRRLAERHAHAGLGGLPHVGASPRCAATATGIRPRGCPRRSSPTSWAIPVPRSSPPSTTGPSTP